ncbi:MAG: cupin domain-containing protein [Alphaproteobacteria bacterium]|nr:cupin domain-containing protein [Alphaproteobacteria bacterium]
MSLNVLDVNHLTWRHSNFANGVWVKDLGVSDGYAMQLVKFEPGAFFPKHQHDKAEFIYILKGELIQNGYSLQQGFVSISDPKSIDQTVASPNGCEFLLLSAA